MLSAGEEVADNGAESQARHAPEPTAGDGESVGRKTGSRDLSLTMIREFIFCAALGLTTYGALHTSPPKVSSHPPAERFFPSESPVVDWYLGQLGLALVEAANADVSLVMYYAPWDAECMHARAEFDVAARQIGDQVYFTAINCWNPDSECRLHNHKIPSWPVIMAYTVNSKGILYRGPRDARSLVRFAELVARPLRRVSSIGDLINLVAVCDAVAVGFTPLTTTYKHYNVWYYTALKLLKYDPLGSVCLAVVTSERLSRELGVRQPALRYMLWNTTEDFVGGNDSWTEAELYSWTVRKLARPVARVHPAWQKSSALRSHIGAGPVLMMFTPLEPLYPQQPSYDLLREVATEYGDCAEREWTREIVRLQQVQRHIYQQRDPLGWCRHRGPSHSGGLKKVLSRYKSAWQNSTIKKTSEHGLYGMLLKNDIVRTVTGSKMDTLLIAPTEECESDAVQDGVFEELQQCEVPERSGFERPETSMLTDEDPLSPARLTEAHVARACKLLGFATRTPLVYPRRQLNYTDVRGYACRTNATLKFVVMDSLRGRRFAESLGVDLASRPDKTAVVILDNKSESQYELHAPYGEASIRDFIRNYTNRLLRRSLRSVLPATQHKRDCGGAVGVLCVEELTARSFGRYVKTSGETAIVLVCSGGCPSYATRSTLAAARLLERYAIRASVARVDAARHDLPWQFVQDAFPTILVFPADRTLDSRSYPSTERVTVSGLVALVARTLGAPTELHLQLAMCNNAAFTEQKQRCLTDMRRHLAALLDRTLKQWRRHASPDVRGALSRRFENLRRVSWDLHGMHASYLNAGDRRQRGLLESLASLTSSWNLRLAVAEGRTT